MPDAPQPAPTPNEQPHIAEIRARSEHYFGKDEHGYSRHGIWCNKPEPCPGVPDMDDVPVLLDRIAALEAQLAAARAVNTQTVRVLDRLIASGELSGNNEIMALVAIDAARKEQG